MRFTGVVEVVVEVHPEDGDLDAACDDAELSYNEILRRIGRAGEGGVWGEVSIRRASPLFSTPMEAKEWAGWD